MSVLAAGLRGRSPRRTTGTRAWGKTTTCREAGWLKKEAGGEEGVDSALAGAEDITIEHKDSCLWVCKASNVPSRGRCFLTQRYPGQAECRAESLGGKEVSEGP